MKIKDLINELKKGDPEHEIYIDSKENETTTNIYVSWDDNGDAIIYETSKA